MQCPGCHGSMTSRLSSDGAVTVNACAGCGGVFLDDGEILSFTRNPRRVTEALEKGLIDPEKSARQCARCEAAMETGGLFRHDLRIDRCPACRGLFLDRGELEQVSRLGDLRVDLDPHGQALAGPAGEGSAGDGDEPATPAEVDPEREARERDRHDRLRVGLLPLPNLALRTAATLVFLYGVLGLLLVAAAENGFLSTGVAVAIGVGIVLLQFVLGPFIMDLTLRFLYRIEWKDPQSLPPFLRGFVDQVARENGMPFPRFGVIDDGAPNAFTYGHTPRNARVVITRGILELLEEDEVKSVVAHEMGHAVHWDMLLMTVAQLVPLLLYYLYRTLIRLRLGNRDKSQPARIAIAVGAYVLYIISEYVVLWFSRTREYHADRFAGNAVGDPNALSRALVKIAYGLAATEPRDAKAGGRGESAGALGALGIFDQGAARALAVASLSVGAATAADPAPGAATKLKELDPRRVADAMQWDLWNPWAIYYEIHSTHPLTVHRIRHLSDQAASMGKEPFLVFNRKKPESYWDDFLLEVAVLLLPAVLLVVPAVLGVVLEKPILFGAALLACGAGSFVKTLFSYGGASYPRMSVAALLAKVKVSQVRPVPATISGTIIGKGVPGLVWSEDFVLRDRTGILFLDYRQPLRIWDWLFGLLRAGTFQGKEITARGWYRRGPMPYFELREMSVEGRMRRCYTYHAKLGWAVALMAIGAVLMGLLARA